MQDTIKFYGLDHLRALAIILVFIYHYRMFHHPEWIDTVGWIGWTGVDLFFVISGFLISGQLFREIREHGAIRLKIFFSKRFFRIIPPYLFTLALYFCFPVFRERESLPPFWKFIFFTQNFGLDVIQKGTFSHAWSLCIEEQFYLILPFILLLLAALRSVRWVIPGTVFLMAASLFFRYYAWQEYAAPNIDRPEFWKVWYMNIYYPTYTRFDGLAAGVLIGYLFQYSEKFRAFINAKGNILLTAGFIAIVLTLFFCRNQYSAQASVFGFTFVALSYGMIVMGTISTSSLISGKSHFLTSRLAVLSYSIYLSHKCIIHLIQLFLNKYEIHISENIVLVLCCAGCIGVGLFYRYGIEKPSVIVKDKVLKKIPDKAGNSFRE
ncbi:acyltransferase [uncultured Chryseobacterium sp.]|uniref:acyltransferase family protein n=1 Tax=uncultured Chryseobacterium sp. TaxID=259322 RepID=UPI0025DE8591|nr:acyltransferase [uncultured Chryseobacterium sp.]